MPDRPLPSLPPDVDPDNYVSGGVVVLDLATGRVKWADRGADPLGCHPTPGANDNPRLFKFRIYFPEDFHPCPSISAVPLMPLGYRSAPGRWVGAPRAGSWT